MDDGSSSKRSSEPTSIAEKYGHLAERMDGLYMTAKG
jgi:hypothetical protein